MNGFELPQNRNDLLRFTQAIKYDDPDSISLFIGDSLMHRRSGGVGFGKSLKIQLGSGSMVYHASQA